MDKNYERSLSRLLTHEGGYTNHPSDPGGPTNFGITIYDYRKYAKPNASAADVKAMTLAQAKWIYRAKYWDAQLCGRLEGGVDYAMFDYGVNSGVGRSGRVLRRIVGLPDSQSQVTDAVVAAANALPAKAVIASLCDERLRFLKSLKTWDVFGKGWGRRVAEVRADALLMAEDLPLLDAPTTIPAQGRGVDPDKFARVRALQALLVPPPGNYDGAIDGDLGPRTVKAFQRWKGIDDDGVVGPITRPLLDKALAEIAPAEPILV